MTEKKSAFELRIEEPYDLDKLLGEMADAVNEMSRRDFDARVALLLGRASVAINRLRKL